MLPDPVPPMARTELSRLAQRWHQLPLDQARCVVPLVHALTQRLLDLAASAEGQPLTPVPDLGPAAALDQLTVAVFECAAGPTKVAEVDLVAELVSLRRAVVAATTRGPSLTGPDPLDHT